MDIDRIKNDASTLAQLVTVVAVAVYALGFLVLSVQHASVGLPQLSLLRPRIVSAGVLLCISAAIPMLEAVRVLIRFLPWPATVEEWIKVAPKLVSELFFVVAASSVLLRQVMVGSYFSPGTHFVWSVVGFVVLAAWTVAIQVREMRPVIRRVGLLLAICFFLFALYRTKDTTTWILFGWFAWCSLVVVQAYGPLTDLRKLRYVNLVQTVVGVVATFSFFGVLVYPRIPAMVGGGEPLPATISFNADKKPPVGQSDSLRVWLLDETDDGYYFLQDKNSKNAVFVPKSEVRAVFFGN
jgi:hypothetical protein